MLAPAEAQTRKTFSSSHAYILAKFLMALGQSRAAIGKFAAAEVNLLEAHGILIETPGPSPASLRECTQSIVEFYAAWHRAEPNNGYNAKSAEWKRKMDERKHGHPT